MSDKPLFQLNGAPALAEALQDTVTRRLRARRRAEPGWAEAWRDEIRRRTRGLSKLEALRFSVWHRQFDGKGVPWLPSLVLAARWVHRRLPRIGSAR